MLHFSAVDHVFGQTVSSSSRAELLCFVRTYLIFLELDHDCYIGSSPNVRQQLIVRYIMGYHSS